VRWNGLGFFSFISFLNVCFVEFYVVLERLSRFILFVCSFGEVITSVNNCMEIITAFIKREKLAPRFRRAKHLIAIPVVGTGMAGHQHNAGLVCGRMR
jgi:hypothetical protein